jgi:CBS domain-containing protein/predicted GNAT family acetyltransferase
MDAITFTESRPSEVLAHLHESAHAESEYLFASHDAGREDLILVAWYAGRAVGYLAATDQRPSELLIWEHVVVPEFRQQGIGRRLLLEAAKRTSPSAMVFIDPMGQLDVDRVVDYYAPFGFAATPKGDGIGARAADILTALGEQREDATSVATLLANKAPGVVTIDPKSKISEALHLMNEKHIGAIVASADGSRVEGIVSERDVLMGIDHEGATFLDRTVASCTTTDVITVTTSDLISEVMEVMTMNRIRHLPVTETGQLVGIVSVGDVLMFRLRELDTNRDDFPRRLAEPT